jgi:hypothetical protein
MHAGDEANYSSKGGRAWECELRTMEYSIAVSLKLVVYWHVYCRALRGLYPFSDQNTLYRGMFSK